MNHGHSWTSPDISGHPLHCPTVTHTHTGDVERFYYLTQGGGLGEIF